MVNKHTEQIEEIEEQSERKNEWIAIKVSSELKEMLQDIAKRNERTMSQQIRYLVKKDYESVENYDMLGGDL